MTEDKKSGITIADVAAAANVGGSTVSRVIRGQGAVSAKTRAGVLEAIGRLGYVPNRLAGSLASTDSTMIGIIIPSLANIVFPDLLRGANEILEKAGYQAFIGVTDYNLAREEILVRSMLAWRPAALLIAGLEHREETRKALGASGARVVEMLDLDGEGMDFVVGFSNSKVGQASALFLIGRGYRRIGYVGHDIVLDTRAGKRFSAFEAALRQSGMTIIDRELTSQASSVGAGREGLARLLSRTPNIDAVYFSNDDMAIGGYFHCLAEAIRVPDRLALFGYNGLEIGRAAPQPLSTILTPRVEIGRAAAQLTIDGGPKSRLDLGFELIEGATA